MKLHCSFGSCNLCKYGQDELAIAFPKEFKIGYLSMAVEYITCDQCKSALQKIVDSIPFLSET